MYVIINKAPDFEINELGEVRNRKTGRLKKQQMIRDYLYCDLHAKNYRFNSRVHRLVAETFIPNPLNLPQVNHKDFNKYNNVVSNLEWCTGSQNQQHKVKMQKELGIYKKPKGNRKYKDSLIIKVRELRQGGMIFKEINKITKIPISTLIHICLGTRRTY